MPKRIRDQLKKEDFFVEFYPIDLGSGIRARWLETGDLLVGHPREGAPHCSAYVSLGKRGKYELVTKDPLHVTPNVVCGLCKTSGFIEGGVWIPF